MSLVSLSHFLPRCGFKIDAPSFESRSGLLSRSRGRVTTQPDQTRLDRGTEVAAIIQEVAVGITTEKTPRLSSRLKKPMASLLPKKTLSTLTLRVIIIIAFTTSRLAATPISITLVVV